MTASPFLPPREKGRGSLWRERETKRAEGEGGRVHRSLGGGGVPFVCYMSQTTPPPDGREGEAVCPGTAEGEKVFVNRREEEEGETEGGN